uniref:Kinesin-like protein n=2 Tax=Alexandrium monilatum TaxID=311494 RepID=A0A7S4S6P9_9DINO
MVHMFMNHHDFVFDEAFDENTGNAAVYTGTASGLVERALEGGHGTVMMYGQTGSGKTFTMTAIYELVAEDLFAGLDDRTVSVCFIELSGDSCFDMLNQGSSCNLATAPDGAVHPFPSVEVEVHDVSELLALIEMATKLRATAATGVHDQSSRSHALCRIFVGPPPGSGIADFEGSLTLVDLAGSEHRIDNAEHNAERRKEGAKINASLAALKECIRATAAGAKFVAFRQNRLTQLLRGCFAGVERHCTVVIATVSPSSKDTEHSLNTLRHACIMDGQGEGKAGQSSHMQGGAVTKELLGEIDVTGIARERKASRKSADSQSRPDQWVKPPPAHQSKQSNTGARKALDRRCVQALPPRVARDLIEARSAFGSLRQRIRLSRAPPPGALGAEAEPAPASAGNDGDGASASGDGASGRQRPASCTAEDADAQGVHAGGGGAPSSDHERAFELFRAFCRGGRGAREWRKNDLRLINMCVVPLLFGPGASIEWAHPNAALDELERYVAEQGSQVEDRPPPAAAPAEPPARADAGGGGTAGPPRGEQRGQRPPALPCSAPSTAGQRKAPGSSSGAPPCSKAERQPEEPQAAARASRRGPRSASPAVRGAQTPVLDPSSCSEPRPVSRGPASHHEAIRLRRAALEEQRKQSLQHALAKNKVAMMTRDEEIQDIEQQLADGNCSSAAAVGLRKRLAALRAVTLREERAAAARRSAAEAAASGGGAVAAPAGAPARAAPTAPAAAIPLHAGGTGAGADAAPWSGSPRGGAARSPVATGGGHFAEACGSDAAPAAESDRLPEPARPPPRLGTGKRRLLLGGRGVGAASAPWANDLSSSALVQAG